MTPLRSLLVTFALLSTVSFPLLAHAKFVDNLDDLSNLIKTDTGSSITTLDDNSGNGTVLFERDNTATDTFVDWRESQTGFFSLSTESKFILTPDATGADNLGSYNVNILFYKDNNYLGEQQVIADTSSTSSQIVNVTAAAASFDYDTANQWFVRIRLVNGPGAFELDSLSAIPEPKTSGLLMGLALLGIRMFRRRRN
jgi:hypothetical protein